MNRQPLPETPLQLVDCLELLMVPGIGPANYHYLVDRFGSPAAVWRVSRSELLQTRGIGPKAADSIRAHAAGEAAAEIELCRQLGIEIVERGSRVFPGNLGRISFPPPLLFRLGTWNDADNLAIAIVGSRRCTQYGIRQAEKLARGLAQLGFTVVSGLARGIDAAAHRAALAAGGRTIAVLASGVRTIYPPEHKTLAAQIAEAGSLISERPGNVKPLGNLFPQRNRVISGLSLGVVVVEAADRSGALITARHALEQNREVFAIPGPIDSLASRGCHNLIRDGARLVEHVDDVVDTLGPLTEQVQAPGGNTFRHPSELKLNPQEGKILQLLDDTPKSIDEIVVQADSPPNMVLATLGVLEMRRFVRRLPGNLYVRC